MNLYLISQVVNSNYDTFDAVVVAAETEEEAKTCHPYYAWGVPDKSGPHFLHDWCKPKDVMVKLIGIANYGTIKGIILASYNAG